VQATNAGLKVDRALRWYRWARAAVAMLEVVSSRLGDLRFDDGIPDEESIARSESRTETPMSEPRTGYNTPVPG
jgi:hypothetical protein